MRPANPITPRAAPVLASASFPTPSFLPAHGRLRPKSLLQYIPLPNAGANTFSTSSQNEILGDDKGASRVDYQSHWGLLSLYYFLDQYSLNNPYPVAQSGASVPGFNALNTGRAQLFSLGDTKTLGSSMVNEFHASFMRANNDLGQPEGGKGI